ncbi:corticosteroid 11-beta-dehydrogenase isozyme 2-like isoform X2 [Scyliorhinus canicula]|uniref:corticosteroid 11-beta-dehydrogenase isozyme 2-like isoform X2 n=1 Tax=Scyliorhinus canicula TaxID=7830 RepID=UPI0018F636FE|nr:corticosteroid 11-beta-dehydrogenase isozyme 2-like isoform X2 [Scyliorhinus canicula]
METSSTSALGLYGFITAAFGAAVTVHFQKCEARLNVNPLTGLSLLLLFAAESLFYIYLPQGLGLVLFTLCCGLLYRWICSNGILSPEGKAVLITGCDSGFGYTLAKRLHSLGFHVFAMVLHEDGEGAQELKSVCCNRLTVIEMDVTNGAMIHKVQKEVAKQLENQGELPFGSMSAYGASKAALEFFSDILRQEMKAWGVQISIIQPGATKTAQVGNVNFWEQQHKKLMDGLSPELLHDYGEEYIAEIQQRIVAIGHTFRQDVGPVINTIVTALLAQNPKPRYTTEFVIDVLKILYYYLPSLVTDSVLNQIFIVHKLLPNGVKRSNINQ